MLCYPFFSNGCIILFYWSTVLYTFCQSHMWHYFFNTWNSKRLDHTIVLVIDTFPHLWIINASPKVIAFTWATGLHKILTINHIRSRRQLLYMFAYYACGMQRCTSNFHSLSVCEVCLGFFSNTVWVVLFLLVTVIYFIKKVVKNHFEESMRE